MLFCECHATVNYLLYYSLYCIMYGTTNVLENDGNGWCRIVLAIVKLLLSKCVTDVLDGYTLTDQVPHLDHN